MKSTKNQKNRVQGQALMNLKTVHLKPKKEKISVLSELPISSFLGCYLTSILVFISQKNM